MATQDNKPPEVPQQAPSNRMPAILLLLAAIAIVGGATANALPNFNLSALPGFNALPKFSQLSLPNFNGIALPNLSLPNISWPDFSRSKQAKAPPPRETATVRLPDPVISAAL